MLYLLTPAFVLVVVCAFLLWRTSSKVMPKLPPLAIRPDDPLMKEAVARAKESLPLFRELAMQPHRSRRIKVPVITSKGLKEYLWADVLAFHKSHVKVRYIMAPVSEEGPFRRVGTCSLCDLVDWQVESRSGHYTGGFTMRVMLIRGREQWGELPPRLMAEEKKYNTDTSWSPATAAPLPPADTTSAAATELLEVVN